MTLPLHLETQWHGDEITLDALPAATYLVRFNEETKLLEWEETEYIPPEPTPQPTAVPAPADENHVKYRVWTNKAGKKVKAKMLKYAKKAVLLETSSGKKISIKLSSLSRGDVDYVRKQVRKK